MTLPEFLDQCEAHAEGMTNGPWTESHGLLCRLLRIALLHLKEVDSIAYNDCKRELELAIAEMRNDSL